MVATSRRPADLLSLLYAARLVESTVNKKIDMSARSQNASGKDVSVNNAERFVGQQGSLELQVFYLLDKFSIARVQPPDLPGTNKQRFRWI